ncbi:MAG: helix-turn-helix transcriptional regulator [Chitinophagales bacterium]|nr:helix-turn-helix transcriptional regulator [Chitinophagales bacterium]
MKQIKRRSDCPISLSLDIFGDKWTLLILRDFMFFENRHFNELVTIESISTNILTDRLNKLVGHGIITKQIAEKNRSSYLYSLTKKGVELIPIVVEIYKWGANHLEGNNAESKLKKRINLEGEKVSEEFMEKLKITHNIL